MPISDKTLGNLGFITVVFDNYSCQDSEHKADLKPHFTQVYPQTQYLFSQTDYSSPTASADVLKEVEDAAQKGVLEILEPEGKYLFVFYEDLQYLTDSRLNSLLDFYPKAKRNLKWQDRPFEAHIFCIQRSTSDFATRKVAYENMKHAVEKLSQRQEELKLRVYLMVFQGILVWKTYLEASVRWVYLASREIRPSISDKAFNPPIFSSVSYAGFYMDEYNEIMQGQKKIKADLDGDTFSKEQTITQVRENFEDILSKCQKNVKNKFDIDGFIHGFPVPQTAIGNIKTYWFQRAKLHALLKRLEDALVDTYYFTVHVPVIENAHTSLYPGFGLMDALFSGIPLDSIDKWGKIAINAISPQSNVQDKVASLEPSIGRKKLDMAMGKLLNSLWKDSESKLSDIILQSIKELFPTGRSHFQEVKRGLEDNLNLLRLRAQKAMGGSRFESVETFLKKSQATAKDRAIQNVGKTGDDAFLIINNEVRRNWDEYKKEATHKNIFFLDEAGNNVLQAFYVQDFDTVQEQMFTLDGDSEEDGK